MRNMSRRTFLGTTFGVLAALGLAGCARNDDQGNDSNMATDSSADQSANQNSSGNSSNGAADNSSSNVNGSSNTGESTGEDPVIGGGDPASWQVNRSSQMDRGFSVDNVLHANEVGDISFCLHVPDSYDGSTPFALYLALPGYSGLRFQGAGANLREDFPFVANDYVADMIVASPQLNDWEDTSARQTIALTRWLFSAYNIDPARVALSGYSGGGETISIVLGMEPNLFAAALHGGSRWDGDLNVLAQARTPIYLAIGEADNYYGSGYDQDTYQELVSLYSDQGLSDDQMSQLVVLDVKPASYFSQLENSSDQHRGGAQLFPHDQQIMGWLFDHVQN